MHDRASEQSECMHDKGHLSKASVCVLCLVLVCVVYIHKKAPRGCLGAYKVLN